MAAHDDFNKNAPPSPPPTDAADDDIWFGLSPADYPALNLPQASAPYAVRDMVPLTVMGTAELRGHEDDIEAALLILSQSAAARRLMQTAQDAGYALHINPPALQDSPAQGLASHADKRIYLRASQDVQALALTLAHELAHVNQHITGGLDLRLYDEHPVSALRTLLAMEADARAHEILIAAELCFGEKDAPDNRLRFPNMLHAAIKGMGIPMLEKLMDAVLPRLPDDISIDKVMAGAFKAFYSSVPLRAQYENDILTALELHAKEDLQRPENYARIRTADDIMRAIDTGAAAHGTPYLQKNAKGYIDLDDPRFLSVSARTQERLSALYALRAQNPSAKDAAPWQAPVHAHAQKPKPQGPRP